MDKQLVSAKLESLRRAVGFRNIAVHQYAQLDWQIVFDVATKRIKDLEAFARAGVGTAVNAHRQATRSIHRVLGGKAALKTAPRSASVSMRPAAVEIGCASALRIEPANFCRAIDRLPCKRYVTGETKAGSRNKPA